MSEQIPMQQRQVAIICTADDILDGEYIKEEGWLPNYIFSKKRGKISRANIVGVIVEAPLLRTENENYSEIAIDDGSGKIKVKDFEGINRFNGLKIGDAVLVIGKPRQYGSEKYILAEIVRKIENKMWLELRKLQLERSGENIEKPVSRKAEEENTIEIVEKKESVSSPSALITVFVRERDKGEGVDIEEISSGMLVNLTQEETERTISLLLKQGILYEVRPGRVKVLE